MRRFFEKQFASFLDIAMCAAMNAVQWRHHLHANSLAELEAYILQGEQTNIRDYYSAPGEPDGLVSRDDELRWSSPVRTAFPENDHTHVDLYPCSAGWSAPTVLMLHALMSASDIGYRGWAKRFNQLGWNACFLHLPFHYSRKPGGYMNGELAISADLVRTAQGLRQGVVELRQLMHMLRNRGCREFGIWGTSYGAWIGALLSFVEADFRFIALMQPIANVEHAVWESGAAIWMRRRLRQNGVTPSLVERHFHLSSPLHGTPLCPGDRVLLVAGDYDRIALPQDVRALHEKWRGSELLVIPQGHFGYRIMPATLARLIERQVF